MKNILIYIAKYVITALYCLYTYKAYRVFNVKDEKKRDSMLFTQNILMFLVHFIGFAILFMEDYEADYIMLYAIEVVYLIGVLMAFSMIYKKASRILLNNMCMLITTGMIIVGRLSADKAFKQFYIMAGATVITMFIPVIMKKVKSLRSIPWLYGVAGIAMLLIVLVLGNVSYGANLSLTIAGITVAPGEFVKLIYVFFIAAMMYKSTSFRHVALTTFLAALHVVILVLSKDLGAALIYFVVYVIMVYVATKRIWYSVAGLGAGVIASVAAYHVFDHIRVRVMAFIDPWSIIDDKGYQITQSLFSIGAGGWFGTGLTKGMPYRIPVAEKDFIFAAITEEMGVIVAIALILICLNTFLMIMNVGIKCKNEFYKYLAAGLACMYGFQVFLTVGGAIKMIPLTGVTLPLVSYGGSSAVSTLIMFAVVQGLYLLSSEDERTKRNEKQKNG